MKISIKIIVILFIILLMTEPSTSQIDPIPILTGVDTLVSVGAPGPVMPLNNNVVPVAAGAPHVAAPSIAIVATEYGKGKVIALGHDNFMLNSSIHLYDNQTFFNNTIAWLDTFSLKTIMVTRGHGEWFGAGDFEDYKAILESRGYTVTRYYGTLTPTALNGQGVVMIGCAWNEITTDEITNVENYVKSGGGLILMGLGWSWLAYHPGTTLEDFPMNKLAKPYGIFWIDGGIHDPIHNYQGSPLFYTFYPNTGIQTIYDAMKYIDTTTAKYPTNLPQILQTTEEIRNNYTNSHNLLHSETFHAAMNAFSRPEIYDFYIQLFGKYPQYYNKSQHFDPNTESTMAWLRERAHRTLADALPLTTIRVSEIASSIGLFAQYLNVWQKHQVLLLDNTYLNSPQLDFINNYLDVIDPALSNLKSISVKDFLGTTSPEVPLHGLDGAVNIFGIPIGRYRENSFPSDIEPGYIDVFCVVVAHEVNHVVDAHVIWNDPDYSARKDYLIASAGVESMNYLRSMLPDSFFVKAPQEFFASIANQWFTDSWKTVELGLVRFDNGFRHPINQALFFMDVYSLKGNASTFYKIDTQGNISHNIYPLQRDNSGNIITMTSPTTVYHFSYDQNGDVTSYRKEPVLTFQKITEGAIVNDGGTSRGCTWADFDNDNDLDLFVANDYDQNNFLYANNGDGTFTKISSGSIVNDGKMSSSVSWGDYDNDSDLDLFVANYVDQKNHLYQNDGCGQFNKVTNGNIVNDISFSMGSSWADYDNDGYPDLFVANGGSSLLQNNFLFHNKGDGSFTKITAGTIVNEVNYSEGCCWGDYDNDGDLDLFVANNNDQDNSLYSNNGDGTFTEITTGIVVNDKGKSMGGSWGDFDNDGDLDLFVTNWLDQNNFLYANNGDGTFTKILSGPVVSDAGHSWGSGWGDFDNDGDLDLFVANAGNQKNFLYSNKGDGTFEKISTGIVVEELLTSTSVSWGDYNNNGFLDLFVSSEDNQNNCLYVNNGNNNNWINIKCVGTISNHSAIGAKVKVKSIINGKSRWQMREISAQTGKDCHNSLNAEFGLGDAAIIDSLKFEWPSGIVQVLTNVAVNQFLTVVEQARVQLWIDKDLIGSTGDVVTIPVNCSDVTGLDVYSAGLMISYDASVLEAIDANLTGTIAGAAGWGPPVKSIIPGQIQIGMAGTTSLTGAGALVNILCKVKGSTGDSTYLHFKNAILNEGDPTASTSDGLLKIVGYDVKGKLYYYSASTVPVKDVKVELTGDSTGYCISDSDGNYEFLNLSTGNYTITPQKIGDQNSAVTAYDASYVLRYYVGLLNLTPYQKIAADVSGNGQVTPYDAAQILLYCIGAIPKFPIGQDWNFVPHDYPITDTTWATCPSYRPYLPLDSTEVNQDFLGIVYGDVSGNWSGSNLSGTNVFSEVSIETIEQTDHKKWLVPITIRCGGDAFSGKIELSLNNVDLKFQSASLVNLPSDEIMFVAHEQNEQISFAFASSKSINDQELRINLLFEELRAVTPSASDFEFVDVIIDDKNTSVTVVENDFTNEIPTNWQLDQNYPNPFNPETSISYQVPKTSLVKIEVFNLIGQRIRALVNEEKSPGTYQINWNGLDEQGKSVVSGIYLYRLQTQNFNQMKRMLLLR